MTESKKNLFDLNIKDKKKVLIFPIMVAFPTLFIYFTIFYGKNETQNKEPEGYDYSLPEAAENKLSDEKLKVIDQYDNFSKKKIDSNTSFPEFNDIVTLEEEKPEKTTSPEQDALKKIQAKLREAEEKQKKEEERQRRAAIMTSKTSNNYNNKNSSIEKKEVWKNETKDDFDSFFEVDNKKEVVHRGTKKYESNTSENNYQTSTNKIEAYVSGDQEVTNGDLLEMRLTKSSIINGYHFDKNTSFYGTVSLQQKRVLITISNINHKPINLKVYDRRDGNLGFFIKNRNFGGEVNEVVTDEGINSITSNNSLLNSGVNTLKNIVKRKKNQQKATILNNSQLILK